MPKIVDGEAIRLRIAQAAWDIISTEGIQSVSMRRVASAMGCTTGLITHHFSDKDDLVTFAYRLVLDRMIADAAACIGREGSVLERLLAAIEAIEPTTPQLKQFTIVLMNFWAQAAFNAKFAARCRQDYRRWRRLISGALAGGVRDGELRPDTDVRAVTDTITLLSDGLGVGMTLTPSIYPLTRRRQILGAVLRPYLTR